MREVSGERLGSTLRRLAEDLVTERRRVAQLERENRELREELETLRGSVAAELENPDERRVLGPPGEIRITSNG